MTSIPYSGSATQQGPGGTFSFTFTYLMSNANTPVQPSAPINIVPQQQGERKDDTDSEKKNVRDANIIAAKGFCWKIFFLKKKISCCRHC